MFKYIFYKRTFNNVQFFAYKKLENLMIFILIYKSISKIFRNRINFVVKNRNSNLSLIYILKYTCYNYLYER